MRLSAWLCVLLTLPVAMLAMACGGETAGEVVSIEIALKSAPSEAESVSAFVTDTGYAIELEAASIRLGSIFAFAPETMARAEPSLWRRLSESLVTIAHAHGGVDLVSGRIVRAEWLEPVTLDALGTGAVLLGAIEAERGLVDTLTLELAREASEGAQVMVRGSATRDDETLSFEGALTLGDDPQGRRVEIMREHIELTDGGRLTIVVHPDVWLRDAELSRATVMDGTGQLGPDSQPGRAFRIGARSPAAFSIEWRP